MTPKRSTKQSTGLNQPTLSFQTKLRSGGSAKAAAKGSLKPPAVRKTDSEESLSSVDRAASPAKEDVKETKARKAKKETVDLTKIKDDERLVLDPNGKEWNGLYKEAKADMGNMAPRESKVQSILRVFDMTSKYGPYVGITRLERWERAKKWGLQPPEEIKKILLTQQGEDDTVYRESVVYGWV